MKIRRSLAGIQKSFGIDIEKGGKKTGTYTDTAENRKLGRVGQKYTKDKEEVGVRKEEGKIMYGVGGKGEKVSYKDPVTAGLPLKGAFGENANLEDIQHAGPAHFNLDKADQVNILKTLIRSGITEKDLNIGNGDDPEENEEKYTEIANKLEKVLNKNAFLVYGGGKNGEEIRKNIHPFLFNLAMASNTLW